MFATCLIAFAIFTSLLSFGPASAQTGDGWRWSLSGDDTLPYLVYEDTGRQKNRFILMCDNEQRTAAVSVAVTDKRARRGQSVVVELTVNGQAVTMTGKIATNNGVYAHVRKAPYKALVTLLRRSGPGTLEVTRTTYTLGERDRVKQLEEFTRTCKLRA